MYFCQMKTFFSETEQVSKTELVNLIENFDSKGKTLSAARNIIKIFEFPQTTISIKSFKIPNLINKIAYRFFRKSKAQRSFENAQILLSKGIGTPRPIAYFQEDSGLFFGKSFYVCEHLEHDLTYRDIIHDQTFPNRHEILKQFTKFTHKLHENGIEFLDHSPGNTLISIGKNNTYHFYLIDLNRMKFHDKMDYQTRIKNFKKLTSDKNMVATMSGEYAKITGNDYPQVFSDMWGNTLRFQEKYHRRRRWKNLFKF